MKPKYKRVLLKLSGESLAGEMKHGIDFETVLKICKPIKECVDAGVEVGIVVGGGNFWRGRSSGACARWPGSGFAAAQPLFGVALVGHVDGIALRAARSARGVADCADAHALPGIDAVIGQADRALGLVLAPVDPCEHPAVGHTVLWRGLREGEKVVRVMVPDERKLGEPIVDGVDLAAALAGEVGEKLDVGV